MSATRRIVDRAREREASGTVREAIKIGVWWIAGVAIPIALLAVFIGMVMMIDHMT